VRTAIQGFIQGSDMAPWYAKYKLDTEVFETGDSKIGQIGG